MLITGFGTKDTSGNRKIIGYRTTVPVYATYLPVGPSCPDTCALLSGGCYARIGNVGYQNIKAHKDTFDPYLWGLNLPHGVLIRWNVSGDVVGPEGPQYRDAIKRVHEERPDLQGWLYTHAWQDTAVQEWVRNLPSNVTVVASCDTENDVIGALLAGFRTYSIVQPGTEKGEWDSATAKIQRAAMRYLGDSAAVPTLSCPAQRLDRAKVGCADCLACRNPGLILFAAHGMGKDRAIESLDRKRLPVIQ